MKRSVSLAFGLSLAANVALLVTHLMRHGDPLGNRLESAFGVSTRARETALDSESAPQSIIETEANGIDARFWSNLLTNDLSGVVAELQGAGVPDKFIRAIVSTVLNDRYSEKRRSIFDPEAPVPGFWESEPYSVGLSPEMRAQLRELQRDQSQEYAALFGEPPIADEMLYYLRRRFGALPAEKLAQLAEITRDYSDLIAQTRQRTLGSPIMPWDREQLTYIEQEQRADIEALLNPEELELYELYSSPTANNLRRRLSPFSPSEEEFRALYDLQKVFDEAYDLSRGPRDADRMRAAAQAQQELNEQFKAVLGEERYTQLQRSMDRSYVAATSIVEHFKLPAENAVAVYGLGQQMEQRGLALRSNRDLIPEERDAQLHELAADASNRLDRLLTPQGARAYRESGAARWINLIEPPPTTRVAPAR